MDYIGLNRQDMTAVAEKMNTLLASYNVYYQNLRSFHWHVQGRSFFDLHELFERYYNDAKENIDEIAERILTIGFKPDGSLSTYLQKTEIDESKDFLKDHEMAEHILSNHAELIKLMRIVIDQAGDAKDEGTIDLIASILAKVEKDAWILQSWLTKNQAGYSQTSLSQVYDN